MSGSGKDRGKKGYSSKRLVFIVVFLGYDLSSKCKKTFLQKKWYDVLAVE